MVSFGFSAVSIAACRKIVAFSLEFDIFLIGPALFVSMLLPSHHISS